MGQSAEKETSVAYSHVNLLDDGIIGTKQGEEILVERCLSLLGKYKNQKKLLGSTLLLFNRETIKECINDATIGLLKRYQSEGTVREFLRLTSYEGNIEEFYHAKIWRENRIRDLTNEILLMNRDVERLFTNEDDLMRYLAYSFITALRKSKRKTNDVVLFGGFDFSKINNEDINETKRSDFYRDLQVFITREFAGKKNFRKILIASAELVKGENAHRVSKITGVHNYILAVIQEFIFKYFNE